MNTLTECMFWASAYFLLLGIIYYIIIRPQRKPIFSRGFILGGLVISLLAGTGVLFNTAVITTNEIAGVLTLPEVVITASEGLEKSQLHIREFIFTRQGILYFSFAISILVFIRFSFSLIYLIAKWRFMKGRKINGLFVIPMQGDHTPFSFFRLVFIPENMFDHPGFDQVLLHERAHIKKLHSLDLVFLEMLSIFFWFHPVIWYLRREIKMQHEFEADRFVLDQKVDKVSYQQLLINSSFRTNFLPITNPFNFSPLKKRVMMMNKQSKSSNAGAIMGLMAALFIFASMLLVHSISLGARDISVLQNFALAEGAVSEVNQSENTPYIQSPPQASPPPTPVPVAQEYSEDVIFTVVENHPSYPGGEEARIRFLQETLRYPNEAREAGLQGTVFISFVVEKDGSISNPKILRGVGESIDKEAMRVINEMPRWNPGRQRGENVRVQFNMPIRFVLNGDDKEDSSEAEQLRNRMTAGEVVLFVDGIKFDGDFEHLNEVVPVADIEGMQVVRGEKARELYGYDNVISITRKKMKF